jgi:hypothetical protein
MAIRNYREIGENLQKIVNRLMANDTLVKLLYYNDADPLKYENLTEDEKRREIFNKLIRIIPKVTAKETTRSVIAIRITSGNTISSNKEFKVINIAIEVFVPWDQWIFKSTNLRPFAILGEIQESLDGKTINGLGKIDGGDFVLSYLTDEIACYEQTFRITQYD